MLGYDFHRQKPIDQYIVDFFCSELNLSIEIDGGSHESDGAFEQDKKRQDRLESLGIQFLRFKESIVRNDINSVLETVEFWINENTK